MNALSIILCDDKKPEYLQMALTEVARQIEAGETSGMVHGLSWEMKTGMDEDGNVTMPNSFTGGYSRHCGKCGMLLQTYCPPARRDPRIEVDAIPQQGPAGSRSLRDTPEETTMERSGFCRDVLTTAMEGGSDYWAKGRNSKHEPGGGGRYLSIEVKDAEDPEDPWHLVDEDKIDAAVNKIITDPDLKIRTDLKANIAGAWATNDAGQIDCEGADVIVQIAAYGEIVFG